MLTRDFGSELLEVDPGKPLPPLPRWEGALRAFAQLQIEASGHLGTRLALGCADRRAAGLLAQRETLVWDDAVLRRDQPGGLTDQETSRLRKLAPHIGELFEKLEAEVGPASLVHQDFRGGNVAVVGDDYLFFDWGNTAIGHPFFSGVNFLHHSRYPIPTESSGVSDAANGATTYPDETLQRYLRDAYLEPWTIHAPASRLREAFELAKRLWYVWLAVQFHQELPHVEPTAPLAMEVRYSIPSFLRHVIRAFTAAGDVQGRG
jgi:hypothetical protein